MLQVSNLATYFFTRHGTAKAVDGIGFTVPDGKNLGLVGESGSGKSVTALSILRLVPYPGRILEGEVILDGENLLEKSEAEMRKGSIPRSKSLDIAEGASFVCNVEKTRCPVWPAWKAMEAVSESLISPTITISGSCLRIDRSPAAKVIPALGFI